MIATAAPEDHLDAYFRDLRKTHPLSREEEGQLATRIHRGDLEARNRLVTANLRFAVDVAKRYQGRGVPLEDLISVANLGLIEAAKRFNGVSGVRFITYAVWWIRRYIFKALGKENHLIHLPSHVVELLSKINRVSRELQQTLQRVPQAEEIADTLGVSPEAVKFAMANDREVQSLDVDPMGPQNAGTLLDRLVASDPFSEPDSVEMIEQAQEVDKLLYGLNSREAEVVRRYYGLDGEGGGNLAEIGRAMDLSRERVRQIKVMALKHLRSRAKELYRRDWLPMAMNS